MSYEYDVEEEDTLTTDPDIKILSDLSNEDFLNKVSDATSFVTEDNAYAYFKTVLSHFQNTNIEKSYGEEILISIRKLIRQEYIFDVFKSKKIILKLPFIFKDYEDVIYAIVYDVLNLDPSVLDEEFCDQDHFENLVKADPQKALVIIGNFSKKFVEDPESYQSPWPLLDLLITQARLFIVPKLVQSYVSIICYLCSESNEFANAKLNDLWKTLIRMPNKDIECHKTIYLGLCHLLDVNCDNPDISIPFESLVNDLSQKEMQEAALNFIYYYSSEMKSEDLNDQNLMSALISLASDKENENAKSASSLLSYLANKNENLALTILQLHSNWMVCPLPQASDVLKLFMTIFQYQNLRNQISEMKHFVNFLDFCLKYLPSAGTISILTTVIRRINLNSEIVSRFIEKGFIKKFINEAISYDDEISSHSLLLFINALAKFDCLDQFLEVIPKVCDALNDKNLSEIAAYAAADLSFDEECLSKMIELHADKFFKKNLKSKSSSMRHNSRRFLRNKKELRKK